MNAFTLYIDGANINNYVDSASFDSFKSQVEGESIWDFRTDSISFEMDKSYLDDNDILVSKTERMYKKLVVLHYYGQKVFTGAIEEVDYDFDTETLTIEVNSIGKIVSEVTVGSFSTLNVNHTLSFMSSHLCAIANDYLENIYPLKMNCFPILDVVDFPFYRSINVTEIDLYFDPVGWPLIRMGYCQGLFYDAQENKYYLKFMRLSETMWIYYLPVLENGVDFDNIISLTEEQGFEKMDSEPIDDSGIIQYIKKIYTKGKDFTFKGTAKFNNIYYSLIKIGVKLPVIIKIEINPEDKYAHTYNNSTIGNILKDIAIMTNSIVWIGPDCNLYFQSRDGIANYEKKNVQNLNGKLIQHGGVELPEAFIMADDVETALIDYYDSFLAGQFKRYNARFEHDEFEGDYPLLLKNLHVTYNNLNLGLIRSVTYKEDLIEIETEKKIDA